MEIEGVVGPRAYLSDGASNIAIRLDRTASQVVADGRPRYAELAARGQVFAFGTALAGTTIVAANNAPIAAAAASILTLFNPQGSGFNYEIIKGVLHGISGTPAAGAWVWNAAYGQTITAAEGASPTKPICTLNGSGSEAKGFTQAALTGSGAQVFIRPFGKSFFAGALAATSPLDAVDEVAGDLICPPGGIVSIASPGTGTTMIVAAAIIFARVPA